MRTKCTSKVSFTDSLVKYCATFSGPSEKKDTICPDRQSCLSGHFVSFFSYSTVMLSEKKEMKCADKRTVYPGAGGIFWRLLPCALLSLLSETAVRTRRCGGGWLLLTAIDGERRAAGGTADGHAPARHDEEEHRPLPHPAQVSHQYEKEKEE